MVQVAERVTRNRHAGMRGMMPETAEQIRRNAVRAVSALDSQQKIRLAGMLASPRDWYEGMRRWEE